MRGKADRAALALLCAACVLLSAGPFLRGRSFFWGDLVYLHHPWRALSAQILQQGRLPAWNPYAYLGMPLAAQMQGAAWYPGTLPFYFFPFEPALVLFHAAHFALAGGLAFLWLRREGFGSAAAFAGAAVFAGCGPLTSRVPFLNHLSSLSLLPAFLLFRDDIWLLGLSTALCFLSGYPPILAGGLVASALLSGLLSRRPSFGRWAMALAWGAGACACLLLPALSLAVGSRRGAGLGLEDTLRFALRPEDWAQWVSPLLLGPGAFSPALLWWKTCYFGFLAWLAALTAFHRLRPMAAALLGVYLLTVGLLVLGGSNPLSLLAWSHLPALHYVRYPGNMSYLAVPAMTLLVAAGLHRRRWAWPCAFAVFLELFAYAYGSHPTAPRPYFTEAGGLVRKLQADEEGHRYLLSPLALQWHRGQGGGREQAFLDLKHRLYGVTNMPYRLAAAANFGEPLVPRASYEFMDFLYSRSGAGEAARLLAWADISVLLTRDPLATGLLPFMGREGWYLYGVPDAVGRALWFPEEVGRDFPAGLSGSGTLPSILSGLPLSWSRPREDAFRASGRTGAGWVFLAEPRISGWRAWLNGRAVSDEPALGAFRKIRVPAGSWRLDFRYMPPAWSLGLCLTLAFLSVSSAYWYNRGRRFIEMSRK